MATEIIYVLKLENDMYYIGKTTNLKMRLQQHETGEGSKWTQLHKFVSVIETRICKGIFDEDNVTKEYMLKYGISNVRGGTYSSVILSDEQIYFLEKEFTHSKNLCFKCNGNHYARDCKILNNKIKIVKLDIDDDDEIVEIKKKNKNINEKDININEKDININEKDDEIKSWLVIDNNNIPCDCITARMGFQHWKSNCGLKKILNTFF